MKKWRRVILITLLIAFAGVAGWTWRERERGKKFMSEIEAAAKRFEMDPWLIKAVVWRESKFQPKARGQAGEIGLMQIQEIAAMEWAEANRVPDFEHALCLDPGTNTLAGTFYLSKLMKRYQNTDDPVPYALADYNAGRSNVLKWNQGAAATNSAVFIEQIGFPGTKNYVKSVMRRRDFYKLLSRVGG